MIRRGRVVAVLLGLGLLLAAATGRAQLFVRPWFVPVVALTGVGLIAAAARWSSAVGRTAAVLLLAPLAVGLALPPDRVARLAGSFGGSAPLTSRLGEGSNPLLGGGMDRVTLLQIMLAEREVGAVRLDGRAVSVIGAVDQGETITRLAMVCCAADARPVSIRVRGSLPEAGEWVRVSGALRAEGSSLLIDADSVDRIPPPSDPFL